MKVENICNIIDTIIPNEGTIRNIVKGVDIFKITKSQDHLKQCYEKGLIFIFQGKKEVLNEGSILTYDCNNYLILSLPTPVECRVYATNDQPILGVRIDADQKIINEILFDCNISFKYDKESKPGIYTECLNNHLIDSLNRLISCIKDEQDRQVLAPLYIKEILYFVLKSPHGYALNFVSYHNDTYYKVSQIADNIYLNYKEKYDVNTLAKQASMSVSSFHSTFKEITGLSPIQYVKKIKLHKARELLLYNKITAKSAAYEVGYESLSQFNREYKRLFGVTPKGESSICS
ncbi:AraC family transcriptional regulator [Clostridium sp. 1001271B_151109_B4]|uniref:AraC family transcriptional regulator n=1 Tax=Clostridium sp. 1001271B_151109_B4 TaxID=2787148 RepID=UPI0018AC041E|nr:AraC family transcriptional regulator [Clostridium sp. 1001271B_151109_B4]